MTNDWDKFSTGDLVCIKNAEYNHPRIALFPDVEIVDDDAFGKILLFKGKHIWVKSGQLAMLLTIIDATTYTVASQVVCLAYDVGVWYTGRANVERVGKCTS